MLPRALQSLITALERLPGIGPKTASRLAFYLLREESGLAQDLAEALQGLKSGIGFCQECFYLTEAGEALCGICADERREAGLICVVEEPLDVIAIERSGAYRGRYHVLHGALSPIEGIGPEDLKIAPLLQRVARGHVREVIIATNPNLEGDATALYLSQQLRPLGVRLTRLARGLPMGSDLEYADPNTLLRALSGRQEMEVP
uniref:Recombination protein RecR n=1 Tax=uncultured Chloroflexota bacterium TaxID=166587 RepID=H5SK84_9CHLR|nr:recombination protein RecR [uncultured bacterium]BAL56570.1 recombination protein RecR [uncultured Chloroflexota bacterium]